MMLNSSSVNDGCRLLISNTGELASTHGSPCGNDQHYAIGSISTATQPILNARAEEGGENWHAPQVGLTVATAALLSAWFPLVSPSGAVVHCVAEQKPFADSAAVRLSPNVSVRR
ncbi:MAG: hypothetical protein IPN47_23495 [Gemmatimonadetes bacterium]|nr:hypothetical protein [Gemmatimonadota bacterium]